MSLDLATHLLTRPRCCSENRAQNPGSMEASLLKTAPITSTPDLKVSVSPRNVNEGTASLRDSRLFAFRCFPAWLGNPALVGAWSRMKSAARLRSGRTPAACSTSSTKRSSNKDSGLESSLCHTASNLDAATFSSRAASQARSARFRASPDRTSSARSYSARVRAEALGSPVIRSIWANRRCSHLPCPAGK